MRVVHLNTERGWRGGERQTLWLAGALAKKGHDSRLVGRPLEGLARRAAEDDVPFTGLSPFFELDPLAAHRLNRFLRANKTEVLHAHTGHAVGLGAFACLGTKVKLVVTRRVDFPLKSNVVTRWKYGRADAVACISGRVREMVLAGGVPARKTALIPSGIDAADYPSTAGRDRLRMARDFGVKDLLIVHAAALTPHKDQATLLRAARSVVGSMPKAKFLILGDGALRADLETQAKELGLRDNVLFLGYKPDVLEWVAMADLFVFSSKEEGLGTALLDALALGVPTAATAAGGIPDIYGGADAPELSPPGDDGALARNMLSVLSDPAEARRRVERGRERVKLFTVDAMAASYEKLYEGLVKG